MNPCAYCTNRYVGCHAECEAYQNWVDEYQEKKQAILRKKREENQTRDFARESIRRSKRHRKK